MQKEIIIQKQETGKKIKIGAKKLGPYYYRAEFTALDEKINACRTFVLAYPAAGLKDAEKKFHAYDKSHFGKFKSLLVVERLRKKKYEDYVAYREGRGPYTEI